MLRVFIIWCVWVLMSFAAKARPLILLTARGGSETGIKGMETGADVYIMNLLNGNM